MQWCDKERKDFPYEEFETSDGMLWHRTAGGDIHPAVEIPDESPYLPPAAGKPKEQEARKP
jgi:hypothetical protein